MGLKFAADLMALSTSKKNSAMSQLQQNIQAAGAGFPVDLKHIVKLSKQAGFKISDDPAQLQAFIDQNHPQGAAARDQRPGVTGTPGEQGMGIGSGQPGQGQQGPDPKTMTPKQRQAMVGEMWAKNAVAAAQKRGESVEKLTQLQNQVTDLKSQVINGSPEQARFAAGKLMSINEIPFSLDRAEWEGADPQHKASMIDIAAGHETDAQKQTRSTNIMNTMLSSGRFTDPQAAQQASMALANGQPIPNDIKGKMKAFTFSELSDQATLGKQLIEMGVPENRVASVIEASTVGGLQNALPTGMNSIMSQQMALKKQELKLEGARVGIEGMNAKTEQGRAMIEAQRVQQEEEHYKIESSKLDLAAQKEENKETMDNFRVLIDMQKAKVKIPKEIIDANMEKVAEAAGLDVSQVHHWWGTTTQEYSAKPASGIAQAAAGKSPSTETKTNDGGGFQKFYKGAKKVVSTINGRETD
jgi:hypothetical protein